ncbi:MAG: transporter [Sphingomonas sp.]|nr:transporter [Sphingomonas sp.]
MLSNVRVLTSFAAACLTMAAAPALANPEVDDDQPQPVATVAAAVAESAPDDADAAPSSPSEWTPLSLHNFGSELTAKWIPVPNGDSGAPRQGWLATADGFFTREAHLAYDYVDGRGFDSHEVLARFNYPLTRRLWAGLEVPFFQQSGSVRDFGDITLSTLVMLHESKNVSINAGVGWRLPTGTIELGNQVFAATPQLNFWSDVGHGFSLRGRVGYQFANSGRPDTFVLNGTIGQTITDHSKAPFGDLSWYVAANWRDSFGPLGGNFVSITPGMRTHLGKNLFLLAGVEFPVTAQTESFNQRFILQFVQGF